jgi:hypothetical protein
MVDFVYAELTQSPERLNVITTKLGTAAGQLYTDKDINKAVKMGAVSNYSLCADGDELEGFIDNIDGGPTAGGFIVGGVKRGGSGLRVRATVAAGVATPLVVKDQVVAGAQLPLGTKGLAQVKKGTPELYKYQVIRLYGNGSAGTDVLLERI